MKLREHTHSEIMEPIKGFVFQKGQKIMFDFRYSAFLAQLYEAQSSFVHQVRIKM